MNLEPVADASAPAANFADLGVAPETCARLAQLEIVAPTPVQAACIPLLLQGKDLLAQAQTGTGKTAAYGLPLLDRIDRNNFSIQAIVLLPTRELALQVAKALASFVDDQMASRIVAIYGGDSFSKQLSALRRGAQVIVATPGRLIDHMDRGSISLQTVRVAVLDEADEMLNMGFLDDVARILSGVPKSRQTALLSATLPTEVVRLAEAHLREPARVRIDAQTRTASTVVQRYTIALPHLRADAVARLLDVEEFDSALIFARTKITCDELTDALQAHGVPCEALHGDLSQPAREAVVKRLRQGRLRVVVATDVAARGLDVPTLDLVVAIELPGEIGTYVHRIGRTGRAGRQGKSILVLGPRDERKLRGLEKFIGQQILFQPVPSEREVAAAKRARYVQKIRQAAAEPDADQWAAFVADCAADGIDLAQVAAALAKMAAPIGVVARLPDAEPVATKQPANQMDEPPDRAPEPVAPRVQPADQPPRRPMRETAPRQRAAPNADGRMIMSLGVGRRNDVTPAMIVAALTRALNVPNRVLGRIDLYDNFSTIEVPEDLARRMPLALRGVDICGRFLNPRPAQSNPDDAPRRRADRRPGPPHD